MENHPWLRVRMLNAAIAVCVCAGSITLHRDE
jgi:hypothetical protein